MTQTIKQLEEKTCSGEITHMVWCDKMDLVALANSKGEVSVHRLSWSRVWIVSTPNEIQVEGMVWRPDGKVLAVAFNTGKVLLLNVENKAVVRTIDTRGTVTSLHWVQEPAIVKPFDPLLLAESDEPNDYMKYIDLSALFLSEPPSSINSTEEDNKKPLLLHNQTELNLLLIGSKEGTISVNVFGCFQCINLNLNDLLGYKCSVEDILLSEDLSNMYVTIKDCSDIIKVICLDSSIFKTHSKELFSVASKYVRLQHLIEYMSETITTVKETWESILLEMDTKLSSYASKVAEGMVAADMLDLLMFGICSNELEEFLLKDLTKKGLEKFGQTIEVSYCNIQKTLLKFLIKYGQNISYHLVELRGMIRMEYRYGVFGMSEALITEAIQSAGCFLVKGCEVQQIINQSVLNYKAFIRWLYTAIMHLMDEPVPPEVPKMTEQDLAYIVEFLQNFDNLGDKGKEKGAKKQFVMERIGQYLSDEPLTIPPTLEGNQWTKFLEQNSCLRENPHIFKHTTNTSLVQQYDNLNQSIDKVFDQSKSKIGEQLKIKKIFTCFKYEHSKLTMSRLNLSPETCVFAFVHPTKYVDILQLGNCEKIKYGRLYFLQRLSHDEPASGDHYEVVDAKFYSQHYLSLLLQESNVAKTSVIYQMSIMQAINSAQSYDGENATLTDNPVLINGSNLHPKLFKSIDGMVALKFAVSGSRRVSVVLADNRRRVKLFEMEGEEEECEEEDADMTSSTVRESDVSMHEGTVV